ncbi:hypothetical protein DPMN_171417 [Dreissena polymorpha]|uniref:Uncharacterized protein n=1 Tax=Dreissena polymorpha TaxID=45954 RepID=A0A9D4IDQ3_DREPO|nr:hypothetical protein DPMN_171417 [Dreissena polymorpha]
MLRNKLYGEAEKTVNELLNGEETVLSFLERPDIDDLAKAVALTYDCKFIKTSVVLNVHVDELLVGVVKQLRIRNEAEVETGNAPTGCASTSISILNKIFKKELIFKSSGNLYI